MELTFETNQPFSLRGGSGLVSWHKEEKRRHIMKVDNLEINAIVQIDGPDDIRGSLGKQQ